MEINIQTYSAKESGSPRRYVIPWYPSHNSGQPAQASSLASLRILTPGRSILAPGRSVLKDFEAFWSRLSPAEVHFPLHFVDFFDFLEILGGAGGGPPFSRIFAKLKQLIPVRKQSFHQWGEKTCRHNLNQVSFARSATISCNCSIFRCIWTQQRKS